jgi:hypothetical protein
MTQEKAHAITLDLAAPLPDELDLGTPFILTVAVWSSSGCDLAGAKFHVLQEGEQVGEIVSAGVLPQIVRRDLETEDYDPRNEPIDTRDSVQIALTAPARIGAFRWTFVLPAQEIGGVAHAQGALTFSFVTAEHRTSLTAWDVPSPIAAGEKFSLKVGAKCCACCALSGQTVVLHDGHGDVVGTGVLGEMQWADAEGLYFTELDVTAPATEGLCQWSIDFPAGQAGLPHRGATAALSFMTVAPARHQVSVAIIARDTAAPIADAQVRLGFHRAATDESGIARLCVATGPQRLFVWKAGYAIPERIVEISEDVDVCVEAEALPEKNPYARWEG